jgi:hypothetical protein
LNDSILVLSSGKSIYGEVWSEDFRHGDAVLDVSEIQSIGKNLSQNATIEIIEGGLHDLGLSELTVRKNYFNKIVSY